MPYVEAFSEEDTANLAASIAQGAKPGDIYLLFGGLGAGKTVFAKGFAAGLGVSELVASPTFTIVNEYHSGRLPLFHFDIYRLEGEDLFDTGCEEYFYGGGVCLVEWPERAAGLLPNYTAAIHIFKDSSKGDNYRKITVLKGETL